MSLILDALKKLDREKAFIRKVTANLADEILKPDPVRPRKKFPLYFAGGLLSVSLTAAFTYWLTLNLGLLPGPGPAPPAATRPAETARQAEPFSPAPEPAKEAREETALPSAKARGIAESKKPADPEDAPLRKPPAGKETNRPPDSAAARQDPGRIAKEDSPPLSAKNRNPAGSRRPSGADSLPAAKAALPKEAGRGIESSALVPNPAREARENIPAPSAQTRDFAESGKSLPLSVETKAGQKAAPEGTETDSAAARKADESRRVQSGASPSELRLTGIVWSEDPSGRCAVINGAIVNEGAEIQGIKVVEILPNRVRFLDRGRPFEIQLF